VSSSRGIAISFIPLILVSAVFGIYLGLTPVTSTLSQNVSCNEGVYNSSTSLSMQNVPVLLMQPGSTGYICVTYQSAWRGNSSQFSSQYFQNDTYQFALSIGKENCVTSMGGGGTCTGTNSYSFAISASPGSIHPSPETNYVSVIYTVHALGNSTGFYDYSAPYLYCGGMPMAVSYSQSKVNASDFTPMFPIPCPLLLFAPVGVSVGGMNVMYVSFPGSS
jgi:hypothetical protein